MQKEIKYRTPSLVGLQIGKLLVLERTIIEAEPGKRHKKRYGYKCRCECGKELIMRQDILAKEKTHSCGCVRYKKGYRYDLKGVQFGKLLVLEYSHTSTGIRKSSVWKCKCECGNFTFKESKDLRTGNVSSCGCSKEICYSFKGIGELSGSYWRRVLRGAKARNLPVVCTMEEIWQKYLEQNKKCALSGLDLVMVKNYGNNKLRKMQTASLDRIDSSKGYTKENIQWVHKDINRMKWGLSDNSFITYCRLIADFHKKKIR